MGRSGERWGEVGRDTGEVGEVGYLLMHHCSYMYV